MIAPASLLESAFNLNRSWAGAAAFEFFTSASKEQGARGASSGPAHSVPSRLDEIGNGTC